MFQINVFFSYKAYTVMLVHIMLSISYIPRVPLSCIHNINSCKSTSPASLNTAVSPPNRNLLVEEQKSIFCNVGHILLAFFLINTVLLYTSKKLNTTRKVIIRHISFLLQQSIQPPNNPQTPLTHGVDVHPTFQCYSVGIK